MTFHIVGHMVLCSALGTIKHFEMYLKTIEIHRRKKKSIHERLVKQSMLFSFPNPQGKSPRTEKCLMIICSYDHEQPLQNCVLT